MGRNNDLGFFGGCQGWEEEHQFCVVTGEAKGALEEKKRKKKLSPKVVQRH